MSDLHGSAKSEISDDLSESPSTVPDVSELDLGGTVDAERLEQISEYLRKDTNLKDASIVVSGTEIPVHRTVVASLSSFFSTALCGAFSESKSKKLVLQDASLPAVHVIIAYAYGVDVEERLTDLDLAMDVWQLAHRFQIDGLRTKAADVVLQSSVNVGYVTVLKHATLYGSLSEQAAAKNALAANFALIAEESNFVELAYPDLLDAIESMELIAEEHEKFEALLIWTRGNSDCSEENLLELFSVIRFQRFEKEKLSSALSKSEALPKAALVNLLKQYIPNGTKTSGILEMSRVDEKNRYTLGWPIHVEEEGTEFIITANKNSSGDYFYFSFHHWAMSANTEWTDDRMALVISFNHRLRQADPSESTLLDEVSKYDFYFRVRKLATKFADFPGKFDKVTLFKNSDRLSLDWDVVRGQKFSELLRTMDLTQINIWVHIRCKRV